MVQHLNTVFTVNPLYGHHSFQYSFIADFRRITGKKRIQHVRRWTFNHKIDPVCRNIHTGYFIHQLVHLHNDDSLVEFCRFGNRRCIFRGTAGINISFLVRFISYKERHSRNQVDKVAAVHFQISMNRPQFDAAVLYHLRQAFALAPCIREIQFPRNPFFKYIQMFRNGQRGLDHVKIMDTGRIDLAKFTCQKIRLFLIIPLYIDIVTGMQDRF